MKWPNVMYDFKCPGCEAPRPLVDEITGVWCTDCWPTLYNVNKLDENGKPIDGHYLLRSRFQRKKEGLPDGD